MNNKYETKIEGITEFIEHRIFDLEGVRLFDSSGNEYYVLEWFQTILELLLEIGKGD